METGIDAGALAWGGLLAFLAVMILVDLKVGSAQKHMTVRTAALWSAIWVGLSVAFGAGLWAIGGGEAGESFFAGYVMEKALSLDNVFVFTLIFAALAVPRDEQPRVLLWGILIALGLRALFFLVAGAVSRFAYLQTGLGVLLVAIAGKLVYGEVTHEKVPTAVTLGAIAGVLIVSIGASLLKERRDDRRAVESGA